MRKYIFYAVLIFLTGLTLSVAYSLGTSKAKQKLTLKQESIKKYTNTSAPSPKVASAYTVSEEIINEAVKDVLPKTLLTKTSGSVFCNNHYYDHVINNNTVEVFIWGYCEEFVKEDGVLSSINKSSMPVKLTFSIEDNKLIFNRLVKPEMDSNYESSVTSIFPSNIVGEILLGFDTSLLYPSPLQQANLNLN